MKCQRSCHNSHLFSSVILGCRLYGRLYSYKRQIWIHAAHDFACRTCRRIASNNNHLYVFSQEKFNQLPGILSDLSCWSGAIWSPSRITNINNGLVRQLTFKFTYYRQASDTRIQKSYRSIIHLASLSPYITCKKLRFTSQLPHHYFFLLFASACFCCLII